MTRRPSVVGLAAALALTTTAAAQVPTVVPYQGHLTRDGAGVDGTLTMTFRLYATPDGAEVLWEEERPIVLEDGVFSVYLGMFEAIAPALDDGGRYLGVTIEGEGEATPRQALGSVPFALHAASARDAETVGGYAAADFATEDWVFQYVRGLGYTTEQWVRQQNYLSGDVLDGYATEAWVREQGYVDEDWIAEQGYADAAALDGYASEEWVREQGYVSAAALDGYASEEWVRAQGYASEQWVRDQGYVGADALAGYASEQWVRDQGYVGADALAGYASEQWVREQGYLTAADLGDYVTTAALDARGYITGAALDARGYVDAGDLDGYVSEAELAAAGYVTADAVAAAVAAEGYVTADALDAAIDARGYLTGADLDADLDARGYLTGADLDAALDARGYLTAADLGGYVTAAALDARGYATSAQVAALAAEVAALRDRIGGPYLLGRSAQTSAGRFAFGGQTGVAAAHAMCQASYANEPTAHLCTPGEAMQAVSTGRYAAAGVFDGVGTWTVTDNAYGVVRGNGSLPNTCQNLLYNSADASNGTRLTVHLDYLSQGNGGGVRGRVVRVDQDVSCATSMPVLCCR